MCKYVNKKHYTIIWIVAFHFVKAVSFRLIISAIFIMCVAVWNKLIFFSKEICLHYLYLPLFLLVFRHVRLLISLLHDMHEHGMFRVSIRLFHYTDTTTENNFTFIQQAMQMT